ncbi:hypothetical protein [Mesobacillus maritimus]|uniref:Uncharacterized protein n=1 Tax=Mesobacillus maritimus TaxID=1643336 RepID=A0ABS7K3M2_9BACI|nr:hypothetical protein [Mesobacillus maritimus]MBY0096788.1 hypothetical protein [Mesobacillus maritimus]
MKKNSSAEQHTSAEPPNEKFRAGIFILRPNGSLAGAMVGSPKVLKNIAPIWGFFLFATLT